jgi:hypothetical protein
MKVIGNVAEETYTRNSPNIKYSHAQLLECRIHFTQTHLS